jgi:hypothetical protein
MEEPALERGTNLALAVALAFETLGTHYHVRIIVIM